MSSTDRARANIAAEHGKQGFVYVLSSPSVVADLESYGIQRPLLKIGCTRKHPIQRAKELSSTGVPIPYRVEYYRDYADCFCAERILHERFAAHRVNDNREFFAVPIQEVIAAMDALPANTQYRAELVSADLTGGAHTKVVKLMSLPFAELFSSFPDDGGDRQLTPEEGATCRKLAQSQGI